MEALLHYVWKHRLFPLAELRTTDGYRVEVIDTGLPNTNAGPDFFNAKLRIDGTLWVGNVEVHLLASDWAKHGHDRDRAYDNVVLHVVGEADCDVCRTDGTPIPQLVLPVPDSVRQGYAELCRADHRPRCHSILSSLPRLTIHSWLSALQAERLEQKAALIDERLRRCNGYWEDAFFITLARNFGFGLNGDAFEAWASSLPFRAIDKHRDDLFQVEAFFFGCAGLLESAPDAEQPDDYYLRLQREYRYLAHKFSLPAPLPAERWRFLRLRPSGFPHVRLAQLARLYHERCSLFSLVMEAESPQAVSALLTARTSDYWETHYTFRHASPRRPKQVGASALSLILINTVVPFLYAYGCHQQTPALCERASAFLESLKAEDNHVVRRWAESGLSVQSAADSQALLQLQQAYCDKRDCLRCRFGFEFLRSKK